MVLFSETKNLNFDLKSNQIAVDDFITKTETTSKTDKKKNANN
jgi:hypothetical protein